MTSRQARRLRREEERKVKRAAYKAGLRESAAAIAAPTAASSASSIDPELLDEFSSEFLAHANSMRERIARNVALLKQNAFSPGESGFVSQNDLQSHTKTRFVSQPAPKRARAQINRANAQHSTGPCSPTGKLASSRNSLKHGLASSTLIIPGEDPAVFESLLESLLAEHQPANTTEQMLIHEMAQSWWLTQRALRFQNECFTAD
jgi:hypothetical protein